MTRLVWEDKFIKVWSEPARCWIVSRTMGYRRIPRQGFWAFLDALEVLPLTLPFIQSAYYATEQEADEGLERWKRAAEPVKEEAA